jgi:diacylglycerol kinase (CTP)
LLLIINILGIRIALVLGMSLSASNANHSTVTLASRSDLQLPRKVWHMATGLLIAGLYINGMARVQAVFILGLIFFFFLFFEMSRLRFSRLNQFVIKLWGPVMRKNEVNKISGILYFLASAIIVIALFPRDIAGLSLLYLACGDPVASAFGVMYGNKSIRFSNGKSLIGTSAGVFTCIIATLVFTYSYPVTFLNWILLSMTGGLIGGTAEMLPFEIDDNFSIPIVSAISLALLFLSFGI